MDAYLGQTFSCWLDVKSLKWALISSLRAAKYDDDIKFYSGFNEVAIPVSLRYLTTFILGGGGETATAFFCIRILSSWKAQSACYKYTR